MLCADNDGNRAFSSLLPFKQRQGNRPSWRAGTTQAASLAGKPSVAEAHISEQEFWGQELERIGIAPGLLRLRKVTAEKLAKGIKRIVGSTEAGKRTEKIGQQ